MLLARVTCPHCWHSFPPHDTLWVAAHPALRGDPRLGEDAFIRFLPSRFTPAGGAIDERGEECTQLACPACHLVVPRLCFEYQPWFVSIVGAPGCGKSYYLASAVQMLRRRMADWFQISFTDTQADMNELVVKYEEQLFVNFHPNKPAALNTLIEKTKANNPDAHTTFMIGGMAGGVRPRPMLFSVRRQQADAGPAPESSRVMCLYDNAGESFLSGADSALSPVTEHLAKARLLLFLFDPTLHAKFRDRLSTAGVTIASDAPADPNARRQHLVLTEMANRTRRHAAMPAGAKTDKLLIVIVTKKDLWGSVLLKDLAGGPVAMELKNPSPGQPKCALRLDRIEEHSRRLREILVETAREIVDAAEGFATNVLYVGVSALGTSPKEDAAKAWVIAPGVIKPDWAEVPLLYGLNRTVPNLIPAGRPSASKHGTKV